jgi:hypothetical protein
MSVLYLTYIPLPSAKVRTPRPSRQDLKKAKDELSLTSHSLTSEKSQVNAADQEKTEDENGKPGDLRTGARNTDDWRTLRQCAQVLSLCRVRDAMGSGMQPMMGYLRYVTTI